MSEPDTQPPSLGVIDEVDTVGLKVTVLKTERQTLSKLRSPFAERSWQAHTQFGERISFNKAPTFEL